VPRLLQICFGIAALFVSAPVVFGQEITTDALVRASARLRRFSANASDPDIKAFAAVTRPQWTPLEILLDDWTEARLPPNLGELDRSLPGLENRLTAELRGAGLIGRHGNIDSVKLSRAANFRDAVVVKASITVPCGTDTSVRIYRFSKSSRTPIFESAGTREYGLYLDDIQFSKPNASGSRLLFTSWSGVQCASVWNVLDYQLFRLAPDSNRSEPIFSGAHSFTIDGDVHVKLAPDELLLELTAEGLEAGFRRAYVLHYRVAASSLTRIDPIALQPEDFVQEWINQSWSEMESRSAMRLVKWHARFHSDTELFFGDFDFAQPCSKRPGYTQVAVEVGPRTVYFLVRDKGGHSYEMSDISYDRQSGCPGETQVDLMKQPSLFEKK
jgi:hypothetical protein